MSDDLSEDTRRPKRGQLLFALLFLAISVLLLAVLGDQTKWVKGKELFAQPRFWPGIGVAGMVGFTALHLWQLPRRRLLRSDWIEGRVWLSVFEWALWFLAYVFLVPLVGYLPTSLVFAPVLTWRMGYRSAKLLWISALFAVVVVLLFKAFLQVKIPGSALYEYLPGAVRTFFILNF